MILESRNKVTPRTTNHIIKVIPLQLPNPWVCKRQREAMAVGVGVQRAERAVVGAGGGNGLRKGGRHVDCARLGTSS
jgi:hypothetical protein